MPRYPHIAAFDLEHQIRQHAFQVEIPVQLKRDWRGLMEEYFEHLERKGVTAYLIHIRRSQQRIDQQLNNYRKHKPMNLSHLAPYHTSDDKLVGSACVRVMSRV